MNVSLLNTGGYMYDSYWLTPIISTWGSATTTNDEQPQQPVSPVTALKDKRCAALEHLTKMLPKLQRPPRWRFRGERGCKGDKLGVKNLGWHVFNHFCKWCNVIDGLLTGPVFIEWLAIFFIKRFRSSRVLEKNNKKSMTTIVKLQQILLVSLCVFSSKIWEKKASPTSAD